MATFICLKNHVNATRNQFLRNDKQDLNFEQNHFLKVISYFFYKQIKSLFLQITRQHFAPKMHFLCASDSSKK